MKTDTQQPVAKYLKDYKSPAFSISHIDLSFDLQDEKTRVESVMTVTRNGAHQEPLVLDGLGLTFISLSINDQQVNDDLITIDEETLTLVTDLSEFTLRIVNEINPKANTALEGLYKSGDAFCTQCEAEGFRRITWYLDRPDNLAKFTTRITADKNLYPSLLSNGNKIEQGELSDNRHFVKWEDPFPKPSYLFALVAGEFDCLTDAYTTQSGREVALELYVDKGNLSKASYAMESLKHSMKWDEDTYGLEYDLDIYMIVAVDFFNMGAMENKGLNVFNSKYVLADAQTATDQDFFNIESIIGHEYFHNWTGNRVTCRDWFQLSLKEGLTVFRDQQFSAAMGSPGVNRIGEVRVVRERQFAEDAGPMAHPIRPEKVIEMNNFYTVTVYDKGAEVIRMMHTLLGKEGFRKGMDLYFKRHDGQAVTCDDFVAAMEDASNVDLKQFRRWYSQSGTPELSLTEEWDQTSKTFNLTVKQFNAPTADQNEKQTLHIPLRIELLNVNGDVMTVSHPAMNGDVLNIRRDSETFAFNGLSERPVLVVGKNFSAPIRISREQSIEALIHTVKYSSDDFSRWDAIQSLYTVLIKDIVDSGKHAPLPDSVIAMYESLLSDENADLSLIAELFQLPGFDSLSTGWDVVPVDALVGAMKHIKQSLTQVLYAKFNEIYQSFAGDKYELNATAIGRRDLKNIALHLMSFNDESKAVIKDQYYNADNMTDTLAAIGCAGNLSDSALFDELMVDFETKWKENRLVMDKWFSLHANYKGEDALERLQNLLTHPQFELNNPNRVSSLIGVFSQRNHAVFHDGSGKGYELLSGILQSLNDINPQVASRLITPLMGWKKFDAERGEMMRDKLQKLADLPNLSKDLFEKVTLSLG